MTTSQLLEQSNGFEVTNVSSSKLSVMVAITFHYRKSRLQYLFEVIRAFCEYPVESLALYIITNVDDPVTIGHIDTLFAPLLERQPCRGVGKRTLTIESWPALDDPWHLPWCHKHLIVDEFMKPGRPFTHFIYVEDDIVLPTEQFLYFVHYRPLLQPYGLIPSFQRIEFNSLEGRLYLADQVGLSDYFSRKSVRLDGISFVAPDYPYSAMYILDSQLADEYVRTRSFDCKESVSVRPQWGLAERAAMGLCYENAPDGFPCRYVIPVNPETLTMPSWAWIYHTASRYCHDPRTLYGKTPPRHMFSDDPETVNWFPPTRLDSLKWLAKRVVRRIRYGRPRSTGNDAVQAGRCLLCDKGESEATSCHDPSCPGRFLRRKAALARQANTERRGLHVS